MTDLERVDVAKVLRAAAEQTRNDRAYVFDIASSWVRALQAAMVDYLIVQGKDLEAGFEIWAQHADKNPFPLLRIEYASQRDLFPCEVLVGNSTERFGAPAGSDQLDERIKQALLCGQVRELLP